MQSIFGLISKKVKQPSVASHAYATCARSLKQRNASRASIQGNRTLHHPLFPWIPERRTTTPLLIDPPPLKVKVGNHWLACLPRSSHIAVSIEGKQKSCHLFFFYRTNQCVIAYRDFISKSSCLLNTKYLRFQDVMASRKIFCVHFYIIWKYFILSSHITVRIEVK